MAAERTTTSLSETVSEQDSHGHSGLGLSAAELRGLPQDSVVGYAAGAFDLFHVGHLNILRQAKRHCDYLIAGVVSDEMLELTKGRAPVVPASERAEIVSHVKFVDEVHIESVEDKLDTWAHVRFDLFFKGDDWKGTPRGRDLEERFSEVGVELVYFPYTVHTSSTRLRTALDLLSTPQASKAPQTLKDGSQVSS